LLRRIINCSPYNFCHAYVLGISDREKWMTTIALGWSVGWLSKLTRRFLVEA